MERRTALTLATAAAGTVMAASAAFAVNVGLLQHDTTQPVGVLGTSAIDSSALVDPTVVTVVVEDPVPTAASANTSTDASTSDPTSVAGATDDGYEVEDAPDPSHDDEGDDGPEGAAHEIDDDD